MVPHWRLTALWSVGATATKTAFAFSCIAVVAFSFPVQADEHSLPDPTLTPGAVIAEATAADICKPGYSTRTRHVDAATKRSVYRAYGLSGNHTAYCSGDQGCEVDHLISLELGGSNDAANLWPEPYGGIVWNAHVKDRLENRLHRMVCDGEISLSEAQQDIADDWVAAYGRWIGGPE